MLRGFLCMWLPVRKLAFVRDPATTKPSAPPTAFVPRHRVPIAVTPRRTWPACPACGPNPAPLPASLPANPSSLNFPPGTKTPHFVPGRLNNRSPGTKQGLSVPGTLALPVKGELPPANHATLGLEGGARFRRKWEGERSDVCRGQFSLTEPRQESASRYLTGINRHREATRLIRRISRMKNRTYIRPVLSVSLNAFL